MNYQPKGSMCANCTKKNDDCSKLDFSKMRPIETIKLQYPFNGAIIKIVKCTEFKK